MPTELARAKLNLTLHVGRKIADRADQFFGYHPLDSLVVFADVADSVSCAPSAQTSLDISGPFAKGLEADDRNLILAAYRAAQRHTDCPALAFTLVKNLPVAAGVGGGSANAAAALRLLKHYVNLTEPEWLDIALKLGADVPVCYASQTARMTGIGESVTPLPGLEPVHAVLVNPGVAVMTGDIFRALDSAGAKETPRPQMETGSLLERAHDGRNDLQPPAIALAPEIAVCLAALSAAPSCGLARMSGSGATCFGLFETQAAADAAAKNLQAAHPTWWVMPAVLGDNA